MPVAILWRTLRRFCNLTITPFFNLQKNMFLTCIFTNIKMINDNKSLVISSIPVCAIMQVFYQFANQCLVFICVVKRQLCQKNDVIIFRHFILSVQGFLRATLSTDSMHVKCDECIA